MSNVNRPILSFTISGEPASKANSRKLVRFGSRPAIIKSDKARSYAEDFRIQCPRLDPLIDHDIYLVIDIWYASRRPDLDESVILDAMQGYIYRNDRQVKKRLTEWHLDRENPRATIQVFFHGEK